MPEAEGLVLEGPGLLSDGKVAIIGGAGGMGRLLAKGLKACGLRVSIRDLDERRGREVARRIGVDFLDGASLKDFGIVIIAVPFEETLGEALKALGDMGDGSLLIDISSVKTGIVEAIKERLPDRIEYISIHPLFGPAIRDLRGKKVVVIPIKAERWLAHLLSIIRKLGCEAIISTVEEHEEAMAKIQALHHFSHLCLVNCLSGLGFDPRFSTESFKRTLGLLRRMDNNLGAILSIQKHNPLAAKMRMSYARVVEELSRMEVADMEEILRRDFENLRRFGGGPARVPKHPPISACSDRGRGRIRGV
ncbi:MAG: prephenate dehydrogenase/arogenate dehydrogenase family protein [Candidatus Bathyarchaeia archaeon]